MHTNKETYSNFIFLYCVNSVPHSPLILCWGTYGSFINTTSLKNCVSMNLRTMKITKSENWNRHKAALMSLLVYLQTLLHYQSPLFRHRQRGVRSKATMNTQNLKFNYPGIAIFWRDVSTYRHDRRGVNPEDHNHKTTVNAPWITLVFK